VKDLGVQWYKQQVGSHQASRGAAQELQVQE
jgi:hypothetical protein